MDKEGYDQIPDDDKLPDIHAGWENSHRSHERLDTNQMEIVTDKETIESAERNKKARRPPSGGRSSSSKPHTTITTQGEETEEAKLEFSKTFYQITRCIDEGDINAAKKIASNPEFGIKHKLFLKNEILIKKLIEKGEKGAARELLAQGYYLDPNTLLKELINPQRNHLLTENLIKGKFYNAKDPLVEIWFLRYYGFYDLYDIMWKNEGKTIESILAKEEFETNIFAHETQIDERFVKDPKVLKVIFRKILQRNNEDVCLAFVRDQNISIVVDNYAIDYAIDMSYMKLVEIFWGGPAITRLNSNSSLQSSHSTTTSKMKINTLFSSDSEVSATRKRASYILERFIKNNDKDGAKQFIEEFPNVYKDTLILDKCLKADAVDHATQVLKLLDKYGQKVSYIDSEVLKSKFQQLDKNVALVGIAHGILGLDLFTSIVLDDYLVQIALINTLVKEVYYITDILSSIPPSSIDHRCAKPLFNVLSHICKHPELIITTERPLMSCVLMAELLQGLAGIGYVTHSSQAYAQSFIKIAECLINQLEDEEELCFFLNHRDWKKRKALDIITLNKYYSLLQSDDVGVMIIKNWHSTSLNNNGLFGASRLYNAMTNDRDPETTGYKHYFMLNIENEIKEPPNPDENEQSVVEDDTPNIIEDKFIFQYKLWPKSCYLRYLASSASNCILFIFYLIVLIIAVDKDVMHDLQDDNLQPWLRITNIWIIFLTFERICFLVYALKTDKLIVIDVFYFGDLVMFVMTIFQMIDLTQYFKFGYGNEREQATFTNGVLISIITVLIWVKIVGIVKTTKLFGPFVGMLASMSIFVFYFMVVAIIWIICYAGIFCALFHTDNADFVDYFTSIRTIFNGFVAAFNFDNFSDRTVDLGRTMFFCYILFATIYLLNLLIAVLSNVYSELLLVIEAEYRSNVNNTYNRFKWDKQYGSLIFAPPPINGICLLFYPFLATKNPQKINTYFTMVMFFFIALFLFIIFLIGDIIFIPFAYLKGFVYAAMPTSKHSRLVKIPLWAFLGIFAVIAAVCMDLGSYWWLVYRNPKAKARKKKKGINKPKYVSQERNAIKRFFTNAEDEVIVDKIKILKGIIEDYVDKEDFVKLKYIQDEWKKQTGHITKGEAVEKIKNSKKSLHEIVKRKMSMMNKENIIMQSMKYKEKRGLSLRDKFRRALIQLGKNVRKMETAQDKFLDRFCNIEGTDIDIDIANRVLIQRTSESENDQEYIERLLHTSVPIIEEAVNSASPDVNSLADFVKVKLAYKEAKKISVRIKELQAVNKLNIDFDEELGSDDEGKKEGGDVGKK